MSKVSRKRIAILISGRGSNMSAIIAACMDPSFPGEVKAVISNRPNAKGLETAKRYEIEAIAVDQKAYADRQAHEQAVLAELDRVKPDIICLAGYMRLLSADFVRRFEGRMINIHPSLLPLFPGLDTHARALAAGMRIHGCTVHYVTERMDEGPIIAQAAIPIEPGDTADSLADRLLRAEHRLYPHALRLVLTAQVRMVNGTAAVLRNPESAERADADIVHAGASPQILVSPDARHS
ncbi:phosphoribosylglycinamide formyltransferase [Jiella sp. MQZ9-1]|uniref:Phosphoribosylglycinamide formyltransferase n=1 Tax=Jiella flava TaxID=2816857 RepID=A0A939FWV2_9HYPH|nr:phosphoribosylglycinamide formyltransferase [Jiella flava]MBO0662334.1 phosphoribosylglycinamide formyltransferase [Jiella flava]MCD2470837.1 phosphoribosylglycinamide formyltransferase [Jiella flava]